MSIPERIPPSPDAPIGWSPNSLGPTAASTFITGISAANYVAGMTGGVVPNGSVPIFIATFVPTVSEVRLWLTNGPYTIVAAPGAGLLLCPLILNWAKVLTVAYGSNTTPTLRYSGQALNLATVNPSLGATTRTSGGSVAMSGGWAGTNGVDYSNRALVLQSGIDNTLGSLGLTLTCYYTVAGNQP